MIAVAGSLHPQDLCQSHIVAAFGRFDKLARSTRSKRAFTMRQLVRMLREDHGAPKLVQFVPRVGTVPPRNVTVTEADRQKVLALAGKPLRLWLLLCSDLAIRSTTAALVGPKNYDSERQTLSFVTKYEAHVTLPVTAEIEVIIRELKDWTKSFVAQMHPNGRMSACTLRSQLNVLCKRAKMPLVRPHDLRRSTAVNVYDASRDLRLVQAILGHKHLQSTLWYLDHRNVKVEVSQLELAKLPPATRETQ